jgi:sulfide:quinone oxidoreductase
MQVKVVTEGFSVSPQILLAELDTITKQGFKALLCNRPDGESPDQTSYAEIEKGAQAQGLEIEWVPVVSGKITQEDVQAFSRAFDRLPKPLLAYCRTGTRSINLWALAQNAKGMSGQEILDRGKVAGYDLSDVVRVLGR